MPVSEKGNWPKVAIGGLVLLNLILFAMLALREPARTDAAVPIAPDSSATGTRSAVSATATPPAEERTPTPTRSTSTPEPSTTEAVRSTRVLAVSSKTLAWRARVGPCPTAPDVEVSRDSGQTWKRTDAGLRSVSRLRSYNESSVFAVGGAEDCGTRYVATGGPAESWGANDGMLGRTWYRVPKQTDRVHAPSGRVSAPCGGQLGDFAGLGDANAAAVCADGRVRTTVTGGRIWRTLPGVDGGVALGADDRVYALALRQDGCDGVAVALLSPGAEAVTTDDVRCAPVDLASTAELAVAVRDQVVWLWAGREVAVSTDRGRSWDLA